MKHTKLLVITLLLGLALSSLAVAASNLNKVNGQDEITTINAETEIENIMSLEEKELYYEPELSDENEEIYSDKQGDKYYFKDTGEIAGYSSRDEKFGVNKPKADEDKVREAANVYLESIVDDPSYYQLQSMDYLDYAYLYSFMYTHQIDGMTTNDVVLLEIDNELNLLSFSLPRPYAFQNIENIQIDRDKIGELALDIFSKENTCDIKEAKVHKITLVEQDGKIEYLVQIESRAEIDDDVTKDLDTVYVPIE